ncbi:hypothetical protein AB6802_18960 [Mesorhizobium sp. RCC_202]|uniref:hypothetical protein n=1 Tax=Mesorhizobium sp. RCC_202 TaxID=3239222 RepID=UPI003524DDF8
MIEDSDQKFDNIALNVLAENAEIIEYSERAEDYTRAIEILGRSHFDLVILDIRLPYLKGGGSPTAQASNDIVQFITRGQAVIPSYIIGLTEYTDEIARAEIYPIEYMIIEGYSSSENHWAQKVCRHIEFIWRSKEASVNYHFRSYHFDVVILTARSENEFKPIDAAIKWGSSSILHDRAFSAFTVKTGSWITTGGLELRTALVCIERTGLASAASVASFMIARFRPRMIAMLGMCCGLTGDDASDKVELGDVVVMSDTYCWDEGRYSEKKVGSAVIDVDDVAFFEARPSSANVAPRLRKIAENLVETGALEMRHLLADAYRRHDSAVGIVSAGRLVPASPKVRIGLNVSGSSVVAARQQTAEILGRFSHAVALEMECHAVYQSVYLAPGDAVEAICIKGVADYGDGKKSKEFQKIASLGSFLVFDQIVNGSFGQ